MQNELLGIRSIQTIQFFDSKQTQMTMQKANVEYLLGLNQESLPFMTMLLISVLSET